MEPGLLNRKFREKRLNRRGEIGHLRSQVEEDKLEGNGDMCWRACDGGGSYSLGTLHILAYSVSFMTPQRWHHHPIFTGAEADAVPFRHLAKIVPLATSEPRSPAISSAHPVTSMLLITEAALHVSTALWNYRWEPGGTRDRKTWFENNMDIILDPRLPWIP